MKGYVPRGRRTRGAVLGVVIVFMGSGLLPARTVQAGALAVCRPKSSLPVTAILLNGSVSAFVASSDSAFVVFPIASPNDFSATPPCTDDPDTVLIHLNTSTNVSSYASGDSNEEVCGSAITAFVTDTVYYTNPDDPITINFDVRFEQAVCIGVPVGDFPSTNNPEYRKGYVTVPAISGGAVGQSLGTASATDDPTSDSSVSSRR